MRTPFWGTMVMVLAAKMDSHATLLSGHQSCAPWNLSVMLPLLSKPGPPTSPPRSVSSLVSFRDFLLSSVQPEPVFIACRQGLPCLAPSSLSCKTHPQRELPWLWWEGSLLFSRTAPCLSFVTLITNCILFVRLFLQALHKDVNSTKPQTVVFHVCNVVPDTQWVFKVVVIGWADAETTGGWSVWGGADVGGSW